MHLYFKCSEHYGIQIQMNNHYPLAKKLCLVSTGNTNSRGIKARCRILMQIDCLFQVFSWIDRNIVYRNTVVKVSPAASSRVSDMSDDIPSFDTGTFLHCRF